MTGYQEALTDPSFAGQLLTFTAPMIGNYGVEDAVVGVAPRQATALICHEARNYAAQRPPGAARLAARRGHRRRSRGSTPARSSAICATAARCCGVAAGEGRRASEARRALAARAPDGGPAARGRGLAASSTACRPRRRALPRRRCSTTAPRPRSCACSSEAGADVDRRPARRHRGAGRRTRARRRAARERPRRPRRRWTRTSPSVRAMLDHGRPLFGICLGHQLLGRALGLETFKLPFGHRGANHPVLERATGRVLVTSQNHGFAVAAPENGDGRRRRHARLALRRHRRGPAGARPRRSGRCSSTPRPRPARTTRARRWSEFVEACRRAGEGEPLMPRRDDLRTIAMIGSGPIVIGQACEFDYSGVQGLKVLREEGYRTVLVNSNPATIMTDPGWADRDVPRAARPRGHDRRAAARAARCAAARRWAARRRSTLAMELEQAGVLDELEIELIGASIHGHPHGRGPRGVRRRRWPRSGCAAALGDRPHVAEARAPPSPATLPLPVVIRPAFTLGGHGGGFARTLGARTRRRRAASPSRRSRRCCSRSRCWAGASSSSR